MRSSNGGLAHGTMGNPQGNLEQTILQTTVIENEVRVRESVKAELIDEELIEELEQAGIKFNRSNMVFITRDQTGQIVWLEKGNELAGLNHIRFRSHDEQIAAAFNVDKSNVESIIKDIITNGEIVKNELKPRGNRYGFERVYYHQGRYCLVTGIGTNGFIISAYPTRLKEE